MDSNNLKRLLAGLSIAGLLAGTSLTLTGCPKPPSDKSGEQAPGQSS